MKLAAYIACHGAIRGIDHLAEMIKEEFPCDGTSNLRLHRTKCSMLIKNVIAPNIIRELVDDMGVDKRFSLLVDETTDIACTKDLCICIRYFSLKHCKVLSALLGIVEVTSTTADALYDSVITFIKDLGLNPAKIVGLGTDGASNLCGCNNSLFTKLVAHNPNLVLVKCVCHSLHLCAQAAFKELPSCIDYLLRESYSWFSHSPNRRFDYQDIWETIEGSTYAPKLVAPAATRWLSLHECVVRILDQWDVLKLHFGLADRTERCYTARMLYGMYNDATNKLYLMFLQPILSDFSKMNMAFQHRDADQLQLSRDLEAFALSLLARVLVPKHKSFDVDLDNAAVYLPLRQVDYGFQFEKLMQEQIAAGVIAEEQEETILMRCFQFMKTACKQVLKRLPSSFEIFNRIENFTPGRCLSIDNKPKFSSLPLHLLPESCSVNDAEREWRSLSAQTVKYQGDIPGNVHEFWCSVWHMTTATNEPAFQNIAQLAIVLLLLPISNAVVEQAFSQVSIVKNKLRNRLNVNMLSALMILRTQLTWRAQCCKSFEPSKGMLRDFNANMYESGGSREELDSDEIVSALADLS